MYWESKAKFKDIAPMVLCLLITLLQFIRSVYLYFYPNGNGKEFTNYLFEVFDCDCDGSITYNDFMRALHSLTKSSTTTLITNYFLLCDINSEGVVTASDMKSVLNSVYKLVGPELTEDMESADSRVDRAFPAMDRPTGSDGNLLTDNEEGGKGEVTPEFERSVARRDSVLTGSSGREAASAEATQWRIMIRFLLYDVDRDGRVSMQDMEKFLTSLYKLVGPVLAAGLEQPASRVERMFSNWKLAGTSHLYLEDFTFGSVSIWANDLAITFVNHLLDVVFKFFCNNADDLLQNDITKLN
ncbi:hypothetical protein EB796_019354 [Bugula neritina]|uniref:EF-hand domain-containing protein n=1 Tax=Bugula neritina TaxID=10212 RepID=A0A7J7J9T0_BUGNE|nr:hypothetical protein EB796_019354 [Bugula neritina]